MKKDSSSNRLEPSLRLIGAVDLWHKYSLADLVTPYFDPVETPLNGYDRLGIRSHGKGTFHSHVAKGNELETAKMSRVASNKLIVNITFAWEHAVAITTEKDANKLVSHRFPQFSINENLISPGFFKYMILDEKFRRHLELSSPGGAGRNRVLKTEEMLKFEMTVPSIDEQKRIELFLDVISKTINQEQQKIEALKKYKRGLLQAMFPANGETVPKVRFPGFTGAWEKRKLGELSRSFEYGLNAAAKEFDGKNKYIRITDIDDNNREFRTDDLTTPDTDLSKADNYRLSEGDILFARTGASVGKTYIYKASDGLVYYAGFLIRANIKDEYNPEFVFQNTLTSDYEIFIKVTSMRSGQPGINAQEYSQYEMMVPSKPEQDRIAVYLRSIDNLITLHQRKLETLSLYKKGLLQQMFI